MRILTILAIALAGTAASASSSRENEKAAAALDRALAGRVAGKTQRCLQPMRIDGPQIVGQTLLYRDGAKLWRTDAVDGCPSLRGDPIIVTEIYGGQFCANDRFRTLIRGAPSIPGPYCRFGAFTPYVKAAKR